MIVVTVGTQKSPFERLLQEIDRLLEEGVIADAVFAQTGYSSYRPRHYEAHAFVDKDIMEQKLREATLVITHGGTGTILQAVKQGKPVIAVPRRAAYGEHVDDHQLQIIEAFERLGYLVPCREVAALAEAYRAAQSFRPQPYRSTREQIVQDIRAWIDAL